MTFGAEWTDALVDGATALGVPPAWMLAVFALESGFDPLARNASGALGIWQKMPPYLVTDPLRQLRDYVAWTRAMGAAFFVGVPTSREALYCLNLAPARLRGGRYDDETELYAAPSAAYRANARAFGLAPADPVGVLRLRHLSVGLDAGIARCRARYDAELAAVNSASPLPPRDYAENAQPAAVVERARIT